MTPLDLLGLKNKQVIQLAAATGIIAIAALNWIYLLSMIMSIPTIIEKAGNVIRRK